MSNDSKRLRLVHMHHEMWNIRLKDPEQALQINLHGAQIARELGESCMELFYECWVVDVLIFYLFRITEALDLSNKLVTKASLPQHHQCPVRARIYMTMVSTHYFRDAIGYRKEVRDMIDFMEREVMLDQDTHLRLQAMRIKLEVDAGNYEKAEEEGLLYLSMSAGVSTYREMDAYTQLTRIAHLMDKDTKTMEYAVLREEKAQYVNNPVNVGLSNLWVALLLRKRGDEAGAQTYYRRGLTQFLPLQMRRSREYYQVMAYFYEAGNETEKLLALYNEQIEAIKDYGELEWLFDAHYQRCCLLKKLNQLTPADLEALRETTKMMKQPDSYLAKLETLQ